MNRSVCMYNIIYNNVKTIAPNVLFLSKNTWSLFPIRFQSHDFFVRGRGFLSFYTTFIIIIMITLFDRVLGVSIPWYFSIIGTMPTRYHNQFRHWVHDTDTLVSYRYDPM
jgi:hypothetical protein